MTVTAADCGLPEEMSAGELANILSCSSRTIRDYGERNIAKRVGRGRYATVESIMAITSHMRQEMERRLGGPLFPLHQPPLDDDRLRRIVREVLSEMEKTKQT